MGSYFPLQTPSLGSYWPLFSIFTFSWEFLFADFIFSTFFYIFFSVRNGFVLTLMIFRVRGTIPFLFCAVASFAATLTVIIFFVPGHEPVAALLVVGF